MGDADRALELSGTQRVLRHYNPQTEPFLVTSRCPPGHTRLIGVAAGHLKNRYLSMPTRNVVLTDQQAKLVENLVHSGRYQNASEVLRDGLRLLQRRELEDTAKLEAIRSALDEAEAAVAEGDVYNYSPTLFDDIDEEERVISTQDSQV